jgi:hypothetical protein
MAWKAGHRTLTQTPRPPKDVVYCHLNFRLRGNSLYCGPIVINNASRDKG